MKKKYFAIVNGKLNINTNYNFRKRRISMSEKVYQLNEYVLGYDKGHNDRSCLTISKIQNGNIYVMGGAVCVISNNTVFFYFLKIYSS